MPIAKFRNPSLTNGGPTVVTGGEERGGEKYEACEGHKARRDQLPALLRQNGRQL